MNRAFKHEFYPDMNGDDYGKKVVSLSCTVNNSKRFHNLTKKERRVLVRIIDTFKKQLTTFQEEIWQPNQSNQ